jgi:two-component system sensor kinase FixL
MGLGLVISRSIVQAHGGRLWADDAATAGAVLRFTIPSLPGSRPDASV